MSRNDAFKTDTRRVDPRAQGFGKALSVEGRAVRSKIQELMPNGEMGEQLQVDLEKIKSGETARQTAIQSGSDTFFMPGASLQPTRAKPSVAYEIGKGDMNLDMADLERDQDCRAFKRTLEMQGMKARIHVEDPQRGMSENTDQQNLRTYLVVETRD